MSEDKNAGADFSLATAILTDLDVSYSQLKTARNAIVRAIERARNETASNATLQIDKLQTELADTKQRLEDEDHFFASFWRAAGVRWQVWSKEICDRFDLAPPQTMLGDEGSRQAIRKLLVKDYPNCLHTQVPVCRTCGKEIVYLSPKASMKEIAPDLYAQTRSTSMFAPESHAWTESDARRRVAEIINMTELPRMTRTCNRHKNCAKADQENMAAHSAAAQHCHNMACEVCHE